MTINLLLFHIDNIGGTHSGSSSSSAPSYPPPPHPGHSPNVRPGMRHSSSLSSASEFTSVSQQYLPHHHPHHPAADRMSLRSLNMSQQVPPNISGSRASFQQALDNPCEYFIDVM